MPRQHSTGGKPRLLGIGKRGNGYLRRLLVHAARALKRSAKTRDDRLGAWLRGLEARAHPNVVTVALGAMAWPPATVGGLILVGSLANTSFLGLPMIETFYGPEHLGLGIVIDQLGTYMVLSTLGILVAVSYASGDASPAAIAKKILMFPPFQAVLLALALKPIEYPEGVEIVLAKLGATLAPLALVSVGYQLRLGDLKGKISAVSTGLAFKLVMGPAVVLGLFAGAFGAGGPTIQITIFEAAMAPQIGASIVAIEHKLDPPLVTLMVGIGIPLSFLTLPLWWYVLQGV